MNSAPLNWPVKPTPPLTFGQRVGVAIMFPIFLAPGLFMSGLGVWTLYTFIMILTGNAPK